MRPIDTHKGEANGGMRVAIDATPLSVPTGGIRRYTVELARALHRCFPQDFHALLADRPFSCDLSLPRSEAAPGGWFGRRWWTLGVQREMARFGCQLFHGTDFAVPYLPVRPSVVTIHDLSPWMPELAPAASLRVRRRTPILLGMGLATMAIVPSNAVRNEVLARFRLPPNRVVAIPEAPAVLAGGAMEKPRRERPYFLFVGTLEPRKNIPALIRAWRPLREKADLILIGRRRSDAPAVADEPGLKLLGERPDGELPSWYAGALACVYPSLYEGFGLPVIEAMAHGCPVIASRDAAITEVAAGAALQVTATDDRELAAALRSVLYEVELHDRLRDSGLRRAAQFTWERTARETREVYAEAIRRFPG